MDPSINIDDIADPVLNFFVKYKNHPSVKAINSQEKQATIT